MDNQGNTMKCTVFCYFHVSSSLKQIAQMKTPHPNWEITVSLTFIVASMLPEIIHKILFNLWNFKEMPWNTMFSSIWWSSTQAHLKQVAEIKTKTPHQNCGKTVSLSYIIEKNGLHLIVLSQVPLLGTAKTHTVWDKQFMGVKGGSFRWYQNYSGLLEESTHRCHVFEGWLVVTLLVCGHGGVGHYMLSIGWFGMLFGS